MYGLRAVWCICWHVLLFFSLGKTIINIREKVLQGLGFLWFLIYILGFYTKSWIISNDRIWVWHNTLGLGVGDGVPVQIPSLWKCISPCRWPGADSASLPGQENVEKNKIKNCLFIHSSNINPLGTAWRHPLKYDNMIIIHFWTIIGISCWKEAMNEKKLSWCCYLCNENDRSLNRCLKKVKGCIPAIWNSSTFQREIIIPSSKHD